MEYMKEIDILAGNAANNFRERERVLDIIGMFMKANIHKIEL